MQNIYSTLQFCHSRDGNIQTGPEPNNTIARFFGPTEMTRVRMVAGGCASRPMEDHHAYSEIGKLHDVHCS